MTAFIDVSREVLRRASLASPGPSNPVYVRAAVTNRNGVGRTLS
jgi:hypothetical protein